LKLVRLQKPLKVFLSHEQIVPVINRKRYQKIINVDYHDDVTWPNRGIKSPRDYNWVNYYRHRDQAVYEWRYPWADCFNTKGFDRLGRCDDDDIWANAAVTGWQRMIHRKGLQRIAWDQIGEIGVIISPAYTVVPTVLRILCWIFGVSSMTAIINAFDGKTYFDVKDRSSFDHWEQLKLL
jgi:hypothetical protein